VASGLVTLNTDGTLSYMANPGFGGVSSFTYSVVDANGAATTATVRLTVTLEAVVSLPNPSDRLDLSAQAPATAVNTLGNIQPRISIEPVILETIGQLGGLNSASRSLQGEQPLLIAVNGLDSLDSNIQLDVMGSRIVDPVRFGDFKRNGETASHWLRYVETDHVPLLSKLVEPASKLSPQKLLESISIESRLRGNVIDIRFIDVLSRQSINDLTLNKLRLKMADGAPLPSWLSWDAEGRLFGTSPTVQQTLDLVVEAETTDGVVHNRTFFIDLLNGKVIEKKTDSGGDRVPLFSQQLQTYNGSTPFVESNETSFVDILRGAGGVSRPL
jgi:Bacterial Ig domain/Putative Ig domain